MAPGSVGPSVPAARPTTPWLIVIVGLVIVPGLTLPFSLRTVIPPKVLPPSDDAVIRIRFGLYIAATELAYAVSLLVQAT